MEMRLPVTGPDGDGKTFLVRILTTELDSDQGTVHTHGWIGHLRQERTPRPAEPEEAELSRSPSAQPGLRPDAGSSAVYRS
ncbi:hypothetical protein [Streptomyces sp. 900116325]